MMKQSILKNFAVLSLLGMVMALIIVLGGGPSAVLAANPPVNKGGKAVVAPKAGDLLRGSNRFVYYVTEDGARQPIMDRETFLAYGFQDKDITEVTDDALAALPVGETLTQLVQNEQGKLCWVMNGRRWEIDNWQPVIKKDTYPGPFISRLDGSLAKTLPVRAGLPDGVFLRQGEQVYYYTQGAIIPVAQARGLKAEISSVPPGILDLYPKQEHLTRLLTQLKADAPAANVRRGPSLDYEVAGTASPASRIQAIGRTADYWLQIEYNGETDWLAGDLVQDQTPLFLLPLVDTSTITPATAYRSTSTNPSTPTNNNSYFGVGITIYLEVDTNKVKVEIMSVAEGGPAERYGVKNGDNILAVDGVLIDTTGITKNIASLRRLLWVRKLFNSFPKGTPVTLTLFRPGTGKTFDLTILRDEVNRSTFSWRCAVEPIRGFGKTWRDHPEIHKLLGCPLIHFHKDEHATRAAVQTFERGWMLWLETDTVDNVDPIYVFFADDGTFFRFRDQPLVDAHSYAPTEPGFYKVGDRFARVYWEATGQSEVRQRLGRATNEASDSLGAFQEFESGRMFWSGKADTIYVIYQGNYNLDPDGEVIWKQGWLSFEDTFESEP